MRTMTEIASFLFRRRNSIKSSDSVLVVIRHVVESLRKGGEVDTQALL